MFVHFRKSNFVRNWIFLRNTSLYMKYVHCTFFLKSCDLLQMSKLSYKCLRQKLNEPFCYFQKSKEIENFTRIQMFARPLHMPH